MMQHVTAFVGWARSQGDEAPFVYCIMHQRGTSDFDDLHNHRRQISHLIGNAARLTEMGFFDRTSSWT